MGQIILAADTTQGACSVALWRAGAGDSDDAEIITELQEMSRGHAEALMPMVRTVLTRSAQPLAAITHFAVTTGPGGFIGVRLGLTAMRVMGFAHARPVIGVPTLTAMAKAHTDDTTQKIPILVAIDAHRGDYFVQLFAPLDAQHPLALAPQVCQLNALLAQLPTTPLVLIGSGAATIAATRGKRDVLTTAPPYPQAGVVAQIAAETEPPIPYHPPKALYLRPPRATYPSRIDSITT